MGAASNIEPETAARTMGLFKADFYRFFALGFAGGALLVLGAMGLDHGRPLSDNIVPPAEAAPAH
jgi:hypothetical protein